MTQEQLEQELFNVASARQQGEKQNGQSQNVLAQELVAAMAQQGNVNKKQNNE
jgi:hypothetical protein